MGCSITQFLRRKPIIARPIPICHLRAERSTSFAHAAGRGSYHHANALGSCLFHLPGNPGFQCYEAMIGEPVTTAIGIARKREADGAHRHDTPTQNARLAAKFARRGREQIAPHHIRILAQRAGDGIFVDVDRAFHSHAHEGCTPSCCSEAR